MQGDLVYVPGELVRVTLNLEDSFSFFEHVVASQQAAVKIPSKLSIGP